MNDPSSNRRKILQGSLAAPLVLTVSSASAQAVTSFTQCAAQGADNQPADAQKIVPTNHLSKDTWFRQPVSVTPWSKDGVTVHAYQVSDGWKNAVTGGSFTPSSGHVRGVDATWHRVVYFDRKTGAPTYLGFDKPPASTDVAVTPSCHTSFPV
jgi:hypothetical protein